MEEEDKIIFLCRLKVMVEVEVEIAVWGWNKLWSKGTRSKCNRKPSPRAKANASGSLKFNLFQ